jgi:hypothetical protein
MKMKVSTLNYLEETVSKYPNKIAIEDENGSITFCELKESAIKIAVTITKYIKDLIIKHDIGISTNPLISSDFNNKLINLLNNKKIL